jgi:hypothetical protein
MFRPSLGHHQELQEQQTKFLNCLNVDPRSSNSSNGRFVVRMATKDHNMYTYYENSRTWFDSLVTPDDDLEKVETCSINFI